MIRLAFIAAFFVALCIGCSRQRAPQQQEEDVAAKQELQGVWIDDGDESVAFKIKGDSVYFPDSTAMPAHFIVRSDTFIVNGVNEVAYPVVKRTPHLFIFVNPNGEQVRLVKTDDATYQRFFSSKPVAVELNQNKLLKRDTVLTYNDERYHSYVQVNPTTYKVIKSGFNDDGVEVGNVYYDNIIHLSIYQGNRKVFSRNVLKTEFKGVVPERFLDQTIFSDLVLTGIDNAGIHYEAVLVVPDSQTSFIVETTVDYNGRLHKSVSKD